MNRRQFLRAGLGLGAAAIIPYDRLMKVWMPPEPEIFLGYDLAVPDSDVTVIWKVDQRPGGYMYSGELTKVLRRSLQPQVIFDVEASR